MITEHRISIGAITTPPYESGAGEPIVSLHDAGPFLDRNASFIRQLNRLSIHVA